MTLQEFISKLKENKPEKKQPDPERFKALLEKLKTNK